MMRLLLILYFVFSSPVVFSQKKDFGSTTSTSLNPTHVSKNPVKQKRLLSWIKNHPRNTLIGNKCMEEITHEMGFEYVLQPKGRQGNTNEFERLIHNFGVKTTLFFKNGPFWKFKLKKMRRQCKARSGDYVG